MHCVQAMRPMLGLIAFLASSWWLNKIYHWRCLAAISAASQYINQWQLWFFILKVLNSDVVEVFQGRGSKLTGWGKAMQQMLKLWGLSWLTPNHHSAFYVAYPLTISTRAVRSRQRRGSFSLAGARQWNTEAAGMRPRHQHFLPRGSFEARHLRRGLHHWYSNIICPICILLAASHGPSEKNCAVYLRQNSNNSTRQQQIQTSWHSCAIHANIVVHVRYDDDDDGDNDDCWLLICIAHYAKRL